MVGWLAIPCSRYGPFKPYSHPSIQPWHWQRMLAGKCRAANPSGDLSIRLLWRPMVRCCGSPHAQQLCVGLTRSLRVTPVRMPYVTFRGNPMVRGRRSSLDHLVRVAASRRGLYNYPVSPWAGKRSSVAEAGAFLQSRRGDITPGGSWTGPPPRGCGALLGPMVR